MKIRSGFVSNSSSSSFVILGREITAEDLVKIPEMIDQISAEEIEEDFGESVYVFGEIASKATLDLDTHNGYDNDCAYVGISYSSIGGDETINQAKTRTAEALTKIGIPTEVSDIDWIDMIIEG